MGYTTHVRGEFTIEPPLTWNEIKASPFEPVGRGKYGAVEYDLDALGLDLAERRAALQFYIDRFGVRPER